MLPTKTPYPLFFSWHPCWQCGRVFGYRTNSPNGQLTLIDFICMACLPTYATAVERGTLQIPDTIPLTEAARWYGVSSTVLRPMLATQHVAIRRVARRPAVALTDWLRFLHVDGLSPAPPRI